MQATSKGSNRLVLLAALVMLATLTLLLATLSDPGIAWDEGITIRRGQRIGAWFSEIVRPHQLPSRAAAFRPEVIVDRSPSGANDLNASYWPFVWVLEGHPPGYAMLVQGGWFVSHRWLGPLAAYRFGPAFLFSVTTGVVFLCLARWYGLRAAWVALAAWFFFPRLFAHAHFASYDVPVLCFWVLATLAFVKACGAVSSSSAEKSNPSQTNASVSDKSNRKGGSRVGRTWSLRWTVLFGLLLGLAFLTKFTGWVAVAPLAVWCAVYRDRKGFLVLGLGTLVALMVFWILNPPLWHAPVEGLLRFFEKNLNRARAAHLDIPGRFLGDNFDFDHSLPWYNTLVWVGITLPVGTLVLVLVGMGRVVYGRFQDRVGTLLLLSALVLLVVRALPGAPPHDGIRLFLPSFAFLACLAGVGVARRRGRVNASGDRVAAKASSSHRAGWFPSWAISAGCALLLAGSAWSTWFYHPHQLSHYNLVIGGLPGAVRVGMEPTYYWDAVTDDVLDWINANTEPENKVLFASYDQSSKEAWHLLREWGKLEPHVDPFDPREAEWYVLQHRPSSYRPHDAWLVEHAKPAFVKRLHDPPRFAAGPFRLDVPLISVYAYRDLERALAATRKQDSP